MDYDVVIYKVTRAPSIAKSNLTLEQAVEHAGQLFEAAKVFARADVLAAAVAVLVVPSTNTLELTSRKGVPLKTLAVMQFGSI